MPRICTAGEKCFRVVLKSEILPVQILYSGESALSNPDGHADESLKTDLNTMR